VRHATREADIHRSLHHPRVVSLTDVFEIDGDAFCTVLEYCPGSDLEFYLKTHTTLPEREACSIISQVLSALLYLNSQAQRIIHFDLKPGNILYHHGEIKITDFGLSKVMPATHTSNEPIDLTSQGAGTYWYLPPECFETSGPTPPQISGKVDVWSAGVILYQLLFGRRPFGEGMSQEKLLRGAGAVMSAEVEFPARPAVSETAQAFVKRCLTRRQEDRPDIRTLMNDPFLRRNR